METTEQSANLIAKVETTVQSANLMAKVKSVKFTWTIIRFSLKCENW